MDMTRTGGEKGARGLRAAVDAAELPVRSKESILPGNAGAIPPAFAFPNVGG